ncbi:hypothetical protein CK203_033158 [Vitis vinifera]|uniref:Uncharacterized protein n=1 Tax=Vitis vinifera TaxID=29760 RepID=A0A438G066_VITVI|nr:hypothetical protein CK203_033158 [Vitis vinifera]
MLSLVLIASSLPSDSSLPNSSMVEAPLTINIPCGQSSRAPSEYSRLSGSMQGTNITIPVSVQKSEGFDANGSTSGSLPARKKRKPWSSDEDKELIAAVQKCGEGNWANILKGDFKGDRSASQLSQDLVPVCLRMISRLKLHLFLRISSNHWICD